MREEIWPSIPYFGVSGRAPMKRYKIVDPTREKLMQLYIEQISQVERPLLAIDPTAWLRPHAPTLKERTYEHQPTAWCLTAYLLVSVKDIVRSHAIPTISGSWALPLRHERITSWDNPIGKGAEQLARFVCISSA